MSARDAEHDRGTGAIHDDRDRKANDTGDCTYHERYGHLFAAWHLAAEADHCANRGEEEGEEYHVAAHDHQCLALVFVERIVDEGGMGVADIYRLGLPVAVRGAT